MGCGHDDGTPSRVPVGLLDNRRGVGADDTANGHEEAEGSSRCSHVLAQGPHDPVGSRAIPEDAHSAIDEANDDADGAAHHSTHLHLVHVGRAGVGRVDRYRHAASG